MPAYTYIPIAGGNVGLLILGGCDGEDVIPNPIYLFIASFFEVKVIHIIINNNYYNNINNNINNNNKSTTTRVNGDNLISLTRVAYYYMVMNMK